MYLRTVLPMAHSATAAAQRASYHYSKLYWRRKRDSNPRNPFEFNGFQDRRLQPLGHSSNTILHGSIRSSSRQGSQPGIDAFQAPDEVRVLDLALRGLLSLDGERTAGFEDTLLQASEPSP